MTSWQKLACMLITGCCVLCSASVHAEFIISIDLDPADGIQSTNIVPVNMNDEITASIFMEMTDSSTVSIYNFSIQFGDGLEFIQTERSELDFGPLVGDQDTTNRFDINSRIASGFDAGILGSGGYSNSLGSTSTGPVLIGTMKFKVIGSSNLTIVPLLADPISFDMFLDELGNEVQPNEIVFNSGQLVNITAVPEPSSIVLLTIASLGLLAKRSYRSNRAV